MSPQLEALYLEHAVASYEKQLTFAEFVGQRNWEFSMESGQLTFAKIGFFGRPLVFAAQPLGTSSVGDGSWLWSWANIESNIPPSITQAALQLRESAPDNAPEWTAEGFEIDLGAAQDYQLVLAICGVLQGSATFRGSTGGGGAYFLLNDDRLKLPAIEAPRFIRIFSQALVELPLANHRAAFEGYARFHQATIEPTGNTLKALVAGHEVLAQFDEMNRLLELNARISP